MTVSRAEFGAQNPQAQSPKLPLQIKSGTIPAGLQGHVFVIGPAGSVNSPSYGSQNKTVLPSQNGSTLLYNGDGMIYRFDFEAANGETSNEDGSSNPETVSAYMAARMMRPPCYYADAATHSNPQFHGSKTTPDLRFESIGVARLGKLGIRNQLNTAFLPMQFASEASTRLLVTWDAGRPYEIDPYTLDTVTPVGWNHEWRPVTSLSKLPWAPPTAFETVQTSAHPVFDPQRNGGEVITVNLGRSLANSFSQLVPIAYLLKELKNWITGTPEEERFTPPPPPPTPRGGGIPEEVLTSTPINSPEKETFLDKLKILVGTLWQFIYSLLTFFKGNFVDLILWDGVGSFKTWHVTCNGRPIKIKQSTHQIGVTKDYIVLLDTAFKISVEELLPPLKKRDSRKIEQFIRNLLDHPQLANNHLYIIRRSDLTDSKAGTGSVNAQKIVLPLEAAHFLVDYENPDDTITIHFSHVCAWDAAECISEFDYAIGEADGTPETAFKHLYGIIYNPTDISRLGCATIKISAQGARAVRPQKTDLVADPNLIIWGPAIYAYRMGADYGPAPRIENLYWSCIGSWEELLQPHIENLYKDYAYRELDVEKVSAIAQKGKPSNLIRLNITPLEKAEPNTSRLSVADSYEFSSDITVGSPQFIPARGSDPAQSTAGFIFCIVHYSEAPAQNDGAQTNGNEIWIFDAANLSEGPLCQLYHPNMDFGFTVHSTWLKDISPRTSDYNVPVEADYADVVNNPHQLPEVRDLFENWVFKQREG